MDIVILIHGLGRSSLSMIALRLGIQKAGYRVLSVDYPSRQISIAEAVKDHLEPTLANLHLEPGSRVHFVTHSLGGIVFRAWAARRDPGFPLGRTVMLVPPNHGSEIIDRAGGFHGFTGQSFYGALQSLCSTSSPTFPTKWPISLNFRPT
jgi:triacylglycerol lipase